MWLWMILWACTSGEPEGDTASVDTGDPGPEDCVPAGPPPMPRVMDGTASDLEAVVSINALYEVYCTRAGTPVCTGTLIDSRTVLTSAHCLRTFTAADLGVVVDASARQGEGPLGYEMEGILYLLESVEAHPAYDEETQANDLALLTLSEAIADVTPIPVADASVEVGEQAMVVGYGRGGDGVRTEGTVRISELSEDRYRYVADPSMTCGGDSGGPVLQEVEGVLSLVGVTIAGDADCVDHGDALNLATVRPYVEGR